MATEKRETNIPTEKSDLVLHQMIKARAKALVDFLQIDDEALFDKLKHLKNEEPYKYEGKTEHQKSEF